MEVTYNAPDRQDTAVYEFNIIKNAALNVDHNPETKNDMVAEVEKYVNSIMPVENEKAQAIIDGVFQNIDSEMQNGSATVGEGILTTYGEVTNSDGTVATVPSKDDGFDFEYLDDLLEGVYETDVFGNIVTTSGFDYEETTTEESFIAKTVETVKEKPEIIAAPTGLIAVGAFAGYLMNKKHRDSEAYLNDEEETEN